MRRADVQTARADRAGRGTPRNDGQRAQREVQLRHRAAACGSCASSCTNPGSRSIGSTRLQQRPLRVGVGDRPRAPGSRSPSSSTTPVTRPSRTRMRATSAPGADLGAGFARRIGHRRRQRAGPALHLTLLPPGAGSAAALSSRTAPVPADHGPCAVPKIAARRDGRHAADRSRTTRRRDPRPPSASSAAAGTRRPARARGSGGRSSAAPTTRRPPGSSSDGGVISRTPCRNAAEPRERGAELGVPRRRRSPRTRGLPRPCAPRRSRTPARGRRATSAIRRGSGRTNSTPPRQLHVANDRRAQRSRRVRQRGLRKPGAITLGDRRSRRRPRAARARAAAVPAFAR